MPTDRSARSDLPASELQTFADHSGAGPEWTLTSGEQAMLDAHHARRNSALRRHLATLLKARDARSQLDYALLSWLHDGSGATDPASINAWMARRSQAIARAAAADPDDAMAAWMEAVMCRDDTVCDEQGARRRLQRLEPDDLLTWMLELDDATLSPARIDDVLTRMAASQRTLDIYDRTTLYTYEALRRARLPAPDERVSRLLETDPSMRGAMSAEARDYAQAMSVSAMALPPLKGISSACRGSLTEARHAACTSVMTRLADSGSFLFDLLATERMLVLTAGTPAQAHWRERERLRLWRMASVEMSSDARWMELRMHMSEVEAFDAMQALYGRSTTPPAGWKPPEWDTALAPSRPPLGPGP